MEQAVIDDAQLTAHDGWSTAFVRPLAWILLAASGSAAFQAEFLAIAASGFFALRRTGCGGGLAVRFGNDAVAHEMLRSLN